MKRPLALAMLVLTAALPACSKHDARTSNSTTTTTTSGAMPSSGATIAPGASTQAEPTGFSSETAAQAHCPSDQVVWLNLTSKIYHEKGSRYYGTTKHGEYACRKEADAAGDRNSRAG